MSKFLSLFPIAIQVAKIAEATVPLPGKGSSKLAFAVDAAGAIYDTEEDLRSSWKDKSTFLTAMTRAITTTVALLNAAGVFQKTVVAR